ncbi:hypothetical protein KXD40_000139 [Peronospora effusa]|uniref:Uncharacterized protein n=1 Tax=Peronospora effusa TaxID=542832 RepID=A0A3M6VL18_9STRA|nr:hypothetical protein DD238_001226 [Peronospora effusa]RQM17208.1 hypothetical protein DD237_001859 [Peronospora effusa]UIZ21391.1 hypothetical protein KXD40_000139 [Peronospora effusa]
MQIDLMLTASVKGINKTISGSSSLLAKKRERSRRSWNDLNGFAAANGSNALSTRNLLVSMNG